MAIDFQNSLKPQHEYREVLGYGAILGVRWFTPRVMAEGVGIDFD